MIDLGYGYVYVAGYSKRIKEVDPCLSLDNGKFRAKNKFCLGLATLGINIKVDTDSFPCEATLQCKFDKSVNIEMNYCRAEAVLALPGGRGWGILAEIDSTEATTTRLSNRTLVSAWLCVIFPKAKVVPGKSVCDMIFEATPISHQAWNKEFPYLVNHLGRILKRNEIIDYEIDQS